MDNDLTNEGDLNLNIEDTEDEQKSGKKKLSLKLVIIIGVVVLIVGGAVVAWSVFSKKEVEETSDNEVIEEQADVQKELSDYFETIVTLGLFEVKLADMGGDKNFKTLIELDVDDPAVGDEIKRRIFQIESSVKSMMGSKTLLELQGVDGKIILKTEIINYLNQTLETGKVRNLYFSEYLIM